MNILVSYNWLKEYLKTGLSPEEFASRVSLCGVGVERIYPQGELLDKIVIGKILEIKKHPNADKLKLVKTDIGTKDLEVVCGGTNLREGMKVALALSGAKVRWHGESELVELKPTEIRGVKSEGMICAASEIGLEWQFTPKESHEILDLSGISAKPGTALQDALDLKDTVFDIEVTTNRPDALSVLGIAREAGTILKAPFNPPKIKSIKSAAGDLLKVENKEPGLCYRYQAVMIEGVKVGESPWWLKRKLMTAGTRSINNVVDITNLILWEMGQPLHAFDYNKLEGGKIIVRKAKTGEKIKALDGIEYELKTNHLVIADGKNPQAVAGIMGGEASRVDEGTKTIVLEAATFNPVSVRKTSRELGLRSESSNLFEKGLSTEATGNALYRAAGLVQELCGGKIASKVFNLRSKKFTPKEIALDTERAEKIIGAKLKAPEMADILRRLGFEARVDGKIISAKPPYWREGDIEIAEDLIEEVARIYGYHNLPSELPVGKIPAVPPDPLFLWEKKAKELSVACGYNEIISYSMVSKKMLENMERKPELKLLNPLSVDMEYMRTCLLPGLLEAAGQNEKNFPEANLFEFGRVYLKGKRGELPGEKMHFAGLNYGLSPNGELFYGAKGFVMALLKEFGINDYELKEEEEGIFHPARSYNIYAEKNYIGSFGELHPAIVRKFGVDSRVGFFYFYFDELARLAKARKAYRPLPAYPAVTRDVAFIVDKKQEYAEIEKALYTVHELIRNIEIFDVYEGKGVPKGKKSMALHLVMRSSHKTLETKEADAVWKKAVETLKDKFKAEVRM